MLICEISFEFWNIWMATKQQQQQILGYNNHDILYLKFPPQRRIRRV